MSERNVVPYLNDDLAVIVLVVIASTATMLPWLPKILKAWRSNSRDAPSSSSVAATLV